MEEELFDVGEAAEFLGLHEQTVRQFIQEGKLPAYWLGNRYRLKKSELLESLKPVEPEKSDD